MTNTTVYIMPKFRTLERIWKVSHFLILQMWHLKLYCLKLGPFNNWH